MIRSSNVLSGSWFPPLSPLTRRWGCEPIPYHFEILALLHIWNCAPILLLAACRRQRKGPSGYFLQDMSRLQKKLLAPQDCFQAWNSLLTIQYTGRQHKLCSLNNKPSDQSFCALEGLQDHTAVPLNGPSISHGGPVWAWTHPSGSSSSDRRILRDLSVFSIHRRSAAFCRPKNKQSYTESRWFGHIYCIGEKQVYIGSIVSKSLRNTNAHR